MTEQLSPPLKWHRINEFPEYEVNTRGEVRHGARALRPDVDDRGRRRFTLCRGGKTFKRFASNLVLESFIGPRPERLEACHENGDCSDDRVTNLRWDTHSANLLDRRRHGTNVQGEMVHTAKLTAADVIEIRRIGKPLRQHAERHRVSESLISSILKRKVWTHV